MPPDSEVPHILILAGQSNTVGRGDPEFLDSDLVAQAQKDEIKIAFDLERHRPDEAHASDAWIALTPECQRNPTFGCHYGPEWGVLAVLRKRFPRLLIAKFAMGSSSLLMQRPDATEPPEWSAESRHRERFLAWLAELRASAGLDAHFIGCLWNQGNSDLKVKASDGSAAEYTARLKQFIADLRGASHAELPFVATEVRKGSKPKNTREVNAAIREACAAAGSATCLPLPADAALLPQDDFHLDGLSLLTAGAEAAEELLRLLESAPPPTAAPPTEPAATATPPAAAALPDSLAPMSPGRFESAAALNAHMLTQSYVVGYTLSDADVLELAAWPSAPDANEYPHAARWHAHVKHLVARASKMKRAWREPLSLCR